MGDTSRFRVSWQLSSREPTSVRHRSRRKNLASPPPARALDVGQEPLLDCLRTIEHAERSAIRFPPNLTSGRRLKRHMGHAGSDSTSESTGKGIPVESSCHGGKRNSFSSPIHTPRTLPDCRHCVRVRPWTALGLSIASNAAISSQSRAAFDLA